jgi:hypothetical protein
MSRPEVAAGEPLIEGGRGALDEFGNSQCTDPPGEVNLDDHLRCIQLYTYGGFAFGAPKGFARRFARLARASRVRSTINSRLIWASSPSTVAV